MGQYDLFRLGFFHNAQKGRQVEVALFFPLRERTLHHQEIRPVSEAYQGGA